MRRRVSAALALCLAAPAPALAGAVRAVVPETAPTLTSGLPGAAPTLSTPLSPLAPALAAPSLLVSPSLPAVAVPRAAPAAMAAAPAALAAAPAAASALQPRAAQSAQAAPALLGPDGKPLRAAAPAPDADDQGRAAPEPGKWTSVFDGAALPEGTPLSSLFSLTARVDEGAVSRARAALTRAAERAVPALEAALAERTFQGRPMTLDDPGCGTAAPLLVHALRASGLSADVVSAEFHVYAVHRAGGELLVVDPTVRQFFGGRRAPAGVPRVFVGTFGELHRLFERYAAEKTTRYGVERIYRSEAASRESLLSETREGLRQAEASPLAAGADELGRGYAAAARRMNRLLAPAPAAANGATARGPVKRFLDRHFAEPAPDPAWDAVKASIAPEFDKLSALPKAARAAYLRSVGDQVVAALEARHGTKEIGFHYNLHGGRPEGYLAGGGIKATMGDIALQYDMHAERAYKVYFFRSSKANLYDVLNERNPNLVTARMGDVLVLFRLDSEFLKDALASGLARKPSAISIDFDETRLPGMVGIPKDTFLGPPLLIFRDVGRRLGLSLSRDEETLAVMRYIGAKL